MKDEKEINVSVAKALGWKIEWPDDWRARIVSSPDGKEHRPSDPRLGLWSFIPDYEHDANTRPEMLASLTEEEKKQLIGIFYGERVWGMIDDETAIRLLELDQPTFARLFCKVKGLL